jgi:hypothetical protein
MCFIASPQCISSGLGKSKHAVERVYNCQFPSIAAWYSFGITPLPIPNFRHIFAVFINVLLMLDELVLELLLQIYALVARLRQAVDGVHYKMKAVQLIQHRHVEWRGNGALFLVAADVDIVVVGATVG